MRGGLSRLLGGAVPVCGNVSLQGVAGGGDVAALWAPAPDLGAREKGADWVVGERVADDPAVALRADDLGGAQVAERLRDGRIEQAGRRGQVGDADRPGSANAGQQGEPGGIGEDGVVLGLGADGLRVAEGGDGAAHPFLVNDPAAGPVGGQKVHACSLPDDQVNS